MATSLGHSADVSTAKVEKNSFAVSMFAKDKHAYLQEPPSRERGTQGARVLSRYRHISVALRGDGRGRETLGPVGGAQGRPWPRRTADAVQSYRLWAGSRTCAKSQLLVRAVRRVVTVSTVTEGRSCLTCLTQPHVLHRLKATKRILVGHETLH